MVIEDARIKRAREGDLSAFNELVIEYQSLTVNLCLRMLRQRQAAEDAAQEGSSTPGAALATSAAIRFGPGCCASLPICTATS